ncbi:MAG: hypothetical protein IJB64_00595 [Akkermansia sp.]|nr:hypothetical protein [Akkermansia sp.]MBQ4634910.1 hypothetical protein [Akkermansia sp.]MBQ9096020.1 hypothetical protein [Akkermansia sp.]
MSKGGLPFASSTSERDAPHTHSGLLTNQGGKIHTAKNSNAWIAVLKDKRYTNHQKQRACAVTIGHLRRSMGTVAAGPYITKYARVMQKLAKRQFLEIPNLRFSRLRPTGYAESSKLKVSGLRRF